MNKTNTKLNPFVEVCIYEVKPPKFVNEVLFDIISPITVNKFRQETT
jgi:hypothetical protein